MGLRETLEAATRECAPDDLACVFERDWANEVLADHNHEIVALVLDMGELLRVRMELGFVPGRRGDPEALDLLGRLERIGKERA